MASKWQPIATAPKDKRILGCTLYPNYPEAYAPTTIVWAAYHPNARGRECWRTSEIGGVKMEGVTHWQPLPEPPQE
jgi:hypothetical protein